MRHPRPRGATSTWQAPQTPCSAADMAPVSPGRAVASRPVTAGRRPVPHRRPVDGARDLGDRLAKHAMASSPTWSRQRISSTRARCRRYAAGYSVLSMPRGFDRAPPGRWHARPRRSAVPRSKPLRRRAGGAARPRPPDRRSGSPGPSPPPARPPAPGRRSRSRRTPRHLLEGDLPAAAAHRNLDAHDQTRRARAPVAYTPVKKSAASIRTLAAGRGHHHDAVEDRSMQAGNSAAGSAAPGCPRACRDCGSPRGRHGTAPGPAGVLLAEPPRRASNVVCPRPAADDQPTVRAPDLLQVGGWH